LFRHFSCNENPSRALNTTWIKYCLSSTVAIDSQEKILKNVYEGSRSPRASSIHWNSPRFRKKNKGGYFLTESYIYIIVNKQKCSDMMWIYADPYRNLGIWAPLYSRNSSFQFCTISAVVCWSSTQMYDRPIWTGKETCQQQTCLSDDVT
jgi:hypothetical protein